MVLVSFVQWPYIRRDEVNVVLEVLSQYYCLNRQNSKSNTIIFQILAI